MGEGAGVGEGESEGEGEGEGEAFFIFAVLASTLCRCLRSHSTSINYSLGTNLSLGFHALQNPLHSDASKSPSSNANASQNSVICGSGSVSPCSLGNRKEPKERDEDSCTEEAEVKNKFTKITRQDRGSPSGESS